MTTTAPTTSHRFRNIALLLGVLVSLAALALLAFLLGGGRATRWTLTPPGPVSAGAGGLIPIHLSAELSDAGLRAQGDGVSLEVEQILVVRKERAALKVRLTAGDAPIALDGLRYTLYGPGGERLSEGRLCGKLSIPANREAVVELQDVDVIRAARIKVEK